MSSTIWLTDRTRYEMGLGYCPRSRLLEFHFGPSGYGIRMKAGSLPQNRGIYIHDGASILFQHLQDHDALPDADVVRRAVQASASRYEAVVNARGLRQLDHGEAIETVIKEQIALLTGMIWGLALEVLPWFQANYRVVSVEQEEVGVLGCTCGLGDLIGTVQEHETRDCQGIGWMSRGDVVAESKATQSLAYFELKTTGQGGESFETRWETSIQFAAGILGAEQRLERKIDQSFVIGMFTGRRQGTWDPDTQTTTGPKIQQSCFCYGYRKVAAAPGMADEWAAQWKYKDEHDRNRTLGKGWEKTGVWELPPNPEGIAPAEYWARWIPEPLRQKQFQIIGPLARQTPVLEGFKRQVVAEEQRWQATAWGAYEALEAAGGDWASEGFQAELDRLAPCSWACRRYGKSHECQFADLCLRREGWDRPLEGGVYMLRRPHHSPEVEQAAQRGVELPEDEGEPQEGD